LFTGTITYCKRSNREKGWGGENRPGGYTIKYILPPKAENDSEKAPSLKKETSSEVDEAKVQVVSNYVIPNLKNRIATCKKVELKHKDVFDQEYTEINALIEKYKDNRLEELDDLKMELLQLRVDWAVREMNEKPTKDTFDLVIETCNKVLDAIPDAVFQITPVAKVDFDDIDDKTRDEKEYVKYKKSLVKALSTKLLTHLKTEHGVDAEIEKDLQIIAKYIDTSDPVIHQLKMERYAKLGNFASSITHLNKLLKEESSILSSLNFKVTKRELFTRRIQYCESLGWTYLADIEKAWMKKRFPLGFVLF